MKLFKCPSCSNILYFENRRCEKCGRRAAFSADQMAMLSIEPEGNGWKIASPMPSPVVLCKNSEHDICNWIAEAGAETGYCRACRHNGIVPDIGDAHRLQYWRELEFAKHRLFYTMLRWQLPMETRSENPTHGLIFNFLADQSGQPNVMTGHDNGVITIALAEADDLERERRRLQMGEPYRTLLGHFRHEVGHHYWDILVRDRGELEGFRNCFGDERANYEAALKRHYVSGPPANWQDNYVSVYATTHPWEDFAETWAHYLHIVDTLEMASQFQLEVRPSIDTIGGLATAIDFDPYEAADCTRIVNAWLPFVFTMNSVSRAMGTNDLYPFILSPGVIRKLGFIHSLIRNNTG